MIPMKPLADALRPSVDAIRAADATGEADALRGLLDAAHAERPEIVGAWRVASVTDAEAASIRGRLNASARTSKGGAKLWRKHAASSRCRCVDCVLGRAAQGFGQPELIALAKAERERRKGEGAGGVTTGEGAPRAARRLALLAEKRGGAK